MTKIEHKEIHIKLHKALDSLVGDYITHTGERLSNSSILDLIHWSYEQTRNPTESDD